MHDGTVTQGRPYSVLVSWLRDICEDETRAEEQEQIFLRVGHLGRRRRDTRELLAKMETAAVVFGCTISIVKDPETGGLTRPQYMVLIGGRRWVLLEFMLVLADESPIDLHSI